MTRAFMTGSGKNAEQARPRGWLSGSVAVGLGLTIMLSACEKREEILPGKREHLRAIMEDDAGAANDVVPENRTLPVKLGKTTTNKAWTQRHGTPETRTDHPAFSGAMQMLWSARIGAGENRRHRIVADPVVAGSRVFTLDSEATVAATATDGTAVWSVDLRPEGEGSKDATGGGLAYAKGSLFVTSGFGRLTALDVKTGEVQWTQRLGETATGAPTVKNGVVFLTAGDNTAWAVNAESGRIEWQLDATPSRNNVLGAPAPAVNDQVAIFAFGSGEVQAAFRGGGLRVWDAVISGQRPALARTRVSDITGDPVIAGQNVYVGSHSGRLVAMKASTGERLWTANEGAMNPVWVAGRSVFLVTDRNELVRLDAEDGSRIWGTELPLFVKDRPRRQKEIFAHYGPVMAGGKLIVASNDGVIRKYEPSSGELVGTAEIPGGATTNPVFAGGVMYVVSTKGELYAFR
ncbi:PQQ-binding-like beta-propeller repeat protein [Alisedimentitalea sp. MJ-SS2]|uniref:PQQ-like beta-propeller repeat protein n=1 Tax=Aliisedimentitalea sp. MJ-SS2 TaxID=3049795 RepID=UPI00290C119D|nr:PQQ-binding-like beta-propeller repeat protein [Alisedimentitalea sp. MJ-SS2]MDU8926400.1 PQQ-binding-like beta-propeller repeat protein [Alisedimentitalea sp. MJ-SS2]